MRAVGRGDVSLSAFQAALNTRIAAWRGERIVWHGLGAGVGGHCWRVQGTTGRWFVKTAADARELFEAEADGLRALHAARSVRVPQVLEAGECGGTGYLILEWLVLGAGNAVAAARLGTQLAKQHRCLGARFGWARNNFIGTTPQFNAWHEDWPGFFRDRRLGFQLRLAAENGYQGELQTQGARLLEKLPAFFAGYTPPPSLLHGDLWGGNWGVLDDGEPAVFDPAVYYGDREADLAMTELFGGFPAEFYRAYDAQFPRDAGYPLRRDLYQLYHLLNHLNLFGDAYRAQVERLMQRLLAEAG
ncbi:MAG TPA: fructosamine kinase family protein [Gammaproteobacteria bacterium]|nr:fructosamine kinase family protein [Gammaproteobacteria bacterium]